MDQKKCGFEQACQWVAEEVFNIDIPIASDSEMQMMKLAAKEMVEQLKKGA